MSELRVILRDLSKSCFRAFIFGYVKSVDKTKNTIAITEEATGLVYDNVLLSAGITIYPVVGSMVVACVVDGIDIDGFLLFANEFEQIVFAEGKNDGLVKIKELNKKLNNIETEFNKLKNIFKMWIPPTGAPDSGAALKAALNTWFTKDMPLTKQNEIENKTIIH